MNFLIGWSINSGKLEFVNELIKEWKVKPEDVFHGDNLRRELYDSLSEEDKKSLFPKMYQIFSKWEKWINIIQKIWVEEYLRLEREESKVVYDRKIRPIIDSMNTETKKVIVWVQLLPEFLEKEIKWNTTIKSMFLIRDNVSDILFREEEYAKESEQQRNYINSLSQNKIEKWEAPNQYLLHALAKAKYWQMIKNELKKLWINSLIINTAIDFNKKILWLIEKI